jgi:hypothetical protein
MRRRSRRRGQSAPAHSRDGWGERARRVLGEPVMRYTVGYIVGYGSARGMCVREREGRKAKASREPKAAGSRSGPSGPDRLKLVMGYSSPPPRRLPRPPSLHPQVCHGQNTTAWIGQGRRTHLLELVEPVGQVSGVCVNMVPALNASHHPRKVEGRAVAALPVHLVVDRARLSDERWGIASDMDENWGGYLALREAVGGSQAGGTPGGRAGSLWLLGYCLTRLESTSSSGRLA